MSSPARSLLWLVAICALLLPAAFSFKGVAVADTPLDRTNPTLARQWRFLRVAAPYVPPGAAFTATADDPEKESSLYLLALGLLPDRRALPSSYWNEPTPEQATEAEYRLDLGCASAPPPGFDAVARVPDGCVWKRRAVP